MYNIRSLGQATKPEGWRPNVKALGELSETRKRSSNRTLKVAKCTAIMRDGTPCKGDCKPVGYRVGRSRYIGLLEANGYQVTRH